MLGTFCLKKKRTFTTAEACRNALKAVRQQLVGTLGVRE